MLVVVTVESPRGRITLAAPNDVPVEQLIPELVERHWYHYLMHNQRAELLKALLLLRGSPNIVLINVPWYISA